MRQRPRLGERLAAADLQVTAMVEVVWDAGDRASCRAASGAFLSVGAPQAWSTEDLVASGVAVSLMQTFLDVAADLPVLGYVSAAEVAPAEASGLPEVTIRLCVTVGSTTTPAQVRALCDEARRRAPVSRWLSVPLRVWCDVEVLPDGSG
jgi:hypothetical protein